MVRKRYIYFLFVFLLFLFIIISKVSALTANYTVINPTNSLVERKASNLINFSIGAMNMNVTRIIINFTGSINFDPDTFVVGSNGTSASNVVFSASNTTNYSIPGGSFTLSLDFLNTSAAGIIGNQTTRNFWFNVTPRSMASSLLNVNILAIGIDASLNSTTRTFGFSFRFSGYVKNETGGLQNATNITAYDFTMVSNGPPIETPVASVLSDSNGAFTMIGLNATGGKLYTLKMIYYNSSGTALKVGTTLPPFPPEMFYPFSFFQGDEPEFEFMKPPSLNGSTFYLGPAGTINVTATNGSASQLFGYMIMDQKTGLPLSSNIFGNVTSVQVIVPTNKQYTVMGVRVHSQFAPYAACNGNFMNDTACMTPPRANSTVNPTTEGQQINVQLNLAVNRVQMYGCIGVSGNTTAIKNITAILPKLLPWEGFVPPMRPDNQDINLTNQNQLNISDPKCTGKLAWYNISLLNSNYLVEFYGKNASVENISEHVGAFQNVSYSGQSAGANINQNITLNTLAGSFVAEGLVNTTKLRINIQNSTGGAITRDTPHVDLFVRDNTFGGLTYIIEGLSNGTFYISLPRNATAKAKIFSNNAPPKEKTLNLSLSEVNITLIDMTGGDGGFRRVNASGGLEAMNITSASFSMNMRFLRSSTDCDVLVPSSACELTSTAATAFNPLSALVAGKINMEMKLSASSVTITFYNFDMFAAKQPPMESVMNSEASSGASSADQVWQFGSFVPADVYDYAIVGMPYSDSVIDDSSNINIATAQLYDENWNVIWNSTRGDTSTNFTTDIDEYLGNANNRSYNSTGYKNFTVSGGVLCSKTDSNLTGTAPSSYCFVNTSSNIIYMRVPHFSGISPGIDGSAPASGSSSSTSSSGGGGSGISQWEKTIDMNNNELSVEGAVSVSLEKEQRVIVLIGGQTHHVGVLEIEGDRVKVQIASEPQEIFLSVGEESKFEITEDNYYDLLVHIDTIENNKANMTISYIHELLQAPPEETTREEETSSGQQENTGLSPQIAGNISRIIVLAIVLLVLIISLIVYFLKKKR